MNSLKYTIPFLILLMIGCQSESSNYSVLSKSKTIEKGNCLVPVEYPQIEGDINSDRLKRINKILEKVAEHEFYAHNCDSENPQRVKGEFEILLEVDTLLCIEYRTRIESKNKPRTIYHAIVLNANDNSSQEFESFGIEPSSLIPNFDRSQLLPYIEAYYADKDREVNLLAYQKESNYIITWGVSETNFIIYPGGEGEFFGYDKIEIPFVELSVK